MPREDRTIEQQSVSHESVVSSVEETAGQPGTTASDDRPPFAPPTTPGDLGRLGKYRIVKELGRGGMGAVYLAHDERLRRKVAFKVMLPKFAADAEAKSRFLREARAAAQISSDHVVSIHEAEEIDGVPYIALQYLQGMALDEFLKTKGPLAPAQIVRIGREAALGLAAAHQLGLVHRDIKPSNLWLEAPNGRVKILDFGLAKSVEGDASVDLTGSGVLVGTPVYLAPEQARGEKVDGRTDLYSLGGVLYRLCTGNLPVKGATPMAVLTSLAIDTPTPIREVNPSIPEALAAITHQLLAKKADQRPATAKDLAARLMQITKELTAPALLAAVPVSTQPLQPLPAPASNPFAELTQAEPSALVQHRTATLRVEPLPDVPGPQDQPGPVPRSWLVAGGLALLALILVAGGIVITIRNKDGTDTKIMAPQGAKVEVEQDGKKTEFGPKWDPKKDPGKTPAAASDDDPDRKAAKYILSVAGTVRVNDEERDLRDPADLPAEPFRLTHVYAIRNRHLSDAGMACFKGCRHLKFLDLWEAGVGDAGLANFAGCTSLTKLLLGHTKVGDAGLAHFKDCKNLALLHLAGTSVGDAGLAHFAGCSSLTDLSLFQTKVTGAGLAPFRNCARLATLDLVGTKVTDAGLAYFKDCYHLTVLALDDTAIGDTGLSYLKDCRSLTCLGLRSTKVTDAGLAHLKDNRNLTQINLFLTNVGDEGLSHFKDCRSLVLLNLSGTRVTDKSLAHFQGAKDLTFLNLSGTKATDAGLANFKDCRNLATLWLNDLRLTEAGLAPFADCVNLANLALVNTNITDKDDRRGRGPLQGLQGPGASAPLEHQGHRRRRPQAARGAAEVPDRERPRHVRAEVRRFLRREP